MKIPAFIAAAFALSPLWLAGAEAVFNRDIRPILSENCLACHGPDSKGRKADLRLDLPGADWQEVLARVTSTDPEELMPPPDSHKKPLAAEQVARLRQWVGEGAKYQKHWAFEPLPDKAAGSLDFWVEAGLKTQGLSFAPEAPHHTLVRRVALDLTGLPPTEAMLAKPYESVVEELLASPHFGEHLAVAWLDAARYADTNGYFGDKPRQMWPWRDWVIEAFNTNQPFDQFSIEQIAGDLLPDATLSQKVATGFNRNHMANNESGSIDEEFRVEYVVDRVDTTMTTWLGLTAGCAQCHDHKYDPVSQREFYQLFAFFNNVPEQGLIRSDNPPPLIEVPTEAQRRERARLQADTKRVRAAFAPVHEKLKPRIVAWEKDAPGGLPEPPAAAVLRESFDDPKWVGKGTAVEQAAGLLGRAAKFDATGHLEARLDGFDADAPWTLGLWLNAEGSLSCPLSLIEPEGRRRGIEVIWQKGRIQVNLVHRWGSDAIEVATVEALPAKAWHHLVIVHDGSRKAAGLRVYFDGVPTTLEVRRDSLNGSVANGEPLRIGRRDANLGFYGMLDELRLVSKAADAPTVRGWHRGERLRGILEKPETQRSSMETEILLDDFIVHHGGDEARRLRQELLAAEQAETKLHEAIPTTLVMQEMEKPRIAHVLERGQYDRPGEPVQPGVPEAVGAWPAALPRNRLGLARWLFSEGNPLTARVAVNRFWAQCFGEGLVRTPNDFGSQGEPPTHPELLDWLAATFRADGWNVKALLKRIVMSRTYRQDSGRRRMPQGVPDDPENRLLARGPSGRLSAEVLRDQALAVSGLLVPKIGGPSVKPFQPPGIWESVSYNGEESYVPDAGEGSWRRSLYTYVKRQSPHPMLLTFDGPTREKCTVRRARTNTPLQALLLLNDETFVRAAEALARRSQGKPERIAWMFRAATCRDPGPEEVRLLEGLLQRRQSWTLVAHSILNLDEVLSRR